MSREAEPGRPARRSDQFRTLRVGIGEFVVSNHEEELLTTFALGSCVAVCLWEPAARVAGMLHFMLPDSALNGDRARLAPGSFADTGIALMFRAAYELGAQKTRCIVRLVGGAEMSAPVSPPVEGMFNVGRRNILAARGVLWRNGIMIRAEAVGGSAVRSVGMAVSDGRVTVKTDGTVIAEL
jgi:chemotaxis protein CheD